MNTCNITERSHCCKRVEKCVFPVATVQHRCKNAAKPCHFRFPEGGRGNYRKRAGGLEQPPLLPSSSPPPLQFLIVQQRKHRKVSTTSVWNGRKWPCHGSTEISLRSGYTCTSRWTGPVSVTGNGSVSGARRIYSAVFSPNLQNRKRCCVVEGDLRVGRCRY